MDIEPMGNETILSAHLKLDKDNPNEMNTVSFQALKDSITMYGILQPVVIDQDNNVIDGAHRTMAAKELNLPVPCSRIKITNPTDRRIIRQILNKLKGRHDPVKDAAEFVAILKASEESKLFQLAAIKEAEFYKTISHLQDNEPEDKIEPPPEVPITQPGDVWQMGSHRLVCGDSCIPETYKTLMGKDRAHIIVTDPPYGVDYVAQIEGREGTTGKWKHIQGDELKGSALKEFCVKFLQNLKAYSTEDSAYYVFFGMKTFHHLLQAMDETQIYYALPLIWYKGRPTINWAKYHPDYEVAAYGGPGAKPKKRKEVTMNPVPAMHSQARNDYRPDYEPIAFSGGGSKPQQPRWFAKYDQTTTWQCKPDASVYYNHPTSKPVELAERALLNSSREGEICLDVFAGGGFSLIAAHKLKRIWRGIEIEASYVDACVLRWEHYAQQPATLIRGGKVFGEGYKSFINLEGKKPSGEKDGANKV